MKGTLKILILSLILFAFFGTIFLLNSRNKTYSLSTNQETLFQLSKPTEICQAVGNESLKIYVEDIDNNSIRVKMQESDCDKGNYNCCSNSIYYNNNLKDYTTSDYDSWVAHSIAGVGPYFIEGEEVDNSLYDYFSISNQRIAFDQNNKLKRLNTLKDGETSSIEINLTSPVSAQSYSDLRLSFDYGRASKDINLTEHNSMSIYVYGNDNQKYGPYYIDYQEIKEEIYEKNSSKLIRYNITSENLLNNIPSDVVISKIKIIPYDNYRVHTGYFRIYNLSVNGYNDKFEKQASTIKVSNAENIIRHNMVDKMVENATLKWNINDDNTVLYFYSSFGTKNHIYPDANNVYYGMPYVNNVWITLQKFISQSNKNDKSSKAYFSYNLPNEFKSDKTTYSGTKTFKKGESIGDKLYIYEGPSITTTEKTNNLKKYDYIQNDINLFLGMDCSSSTFLGVGANLPYTYEVNLSKNYWTSNEVYMLGNLSLHETEVEKALRQNNIIDNNTEISVAKIDDYYSSVFKTKYTDQEIYNAYAEVIPGDIISARGHVRMVSGYSYVECIDGTNTTDYTSGFCDNHKGINGNKSYAVTTEIMIGHANQAKRTFKFNNVTMTGKQRFVNETDARWNITLNNELTDITSINDYLNVNGGFMINHRYYFKELLGDYVSGNKTPKVQEPMYMAFRYKELDNIAKTNEIVLPKTEVLYASDYNTLKIDKALKGTFITNYIIEGIKYEINGKTYYSYPEQTNLYSFYYDMDDEIKELISNIDYSNDYTLKVSVKEGPPSSQSAMNSENGYIEILSLSSTGSKIFTSSKYMIGTNYIKNVSKNTNILSYLNNLNAKNYYDVKIFDSNNNQLDNNGLISTGSITKAFYKDVEINNFRNIVSGDTNGDGKVNVVDVAKLFQHYRKTNVIPESENYYILAGDVVNDTNIKLTDVAKLFQYVRGTISNLD